MGKNLENYLRENELEAMANAAIPDFSLHLAIHRMIQKRENIEGKSFDDVLVETAVSETIGMNVELED